MNYQILKTEGYFFNVTSKNCLHLNGIGLSSCPNNIILLSLKKLSPTSDLERFQLCVSDFIDPAIMANTTTPKLRQVKRLLKREDSLTPAASITVKKE